ncbi:Mechanosensitive ion channel-domain-containing protein [Gongronella butleri]|nr:Mechanosensitive ion channel-domain-containing protein [Gongronella butleri]
MQEQTSETSTVAESDHSQRGSYSKQGPAPTEEKTPFTPVQLKDEPLWKQRRNSDDEEEELDVDDERRELETLQNRSHDTFDEEEKKNKHLDDDHEFDWNDDPDKPKRRKTTRERIQHAMSQPCCWHFLSPVMKRIILAVSGSAVFIAVAVAIYLLVPQPTPEQLADPNYPNVRGNVQLWMYWAAFMWHIGWITTLFVELIPSIVSFWAKNVKGRRSEKVKSHMEYYMAMKPYITICLLGAWNWGSWAFLIDILFTSVKSQGYSTSIWRVFACIFVVTTVLFFEKLFIQIIATRFHRSAYADRIDDNKFALKVLDSLSKSEGRRSRQESKNNMAVAMEEEALLKGGKDGGNGYSSSYQSQAGSQGNGDKQRLANLHKRVQGVFWTDRPQALSRMETRKVDINSDDYAKKVAKKLYFALAYPHNPFVRADVTGAGYRTLERHHFRPYFKDEEQTNNAFEVFDKDGNGDVTRREFRDTVVQIYRERKQLAQCVRDTSQALGKIDATILILAEIVTLFICAMAIFNVDLYASLVPLGTFIMGISFMFSNTVKVAFESIMFLFVTHPYDAGDNVLIDGVTLTVHNMGITGTVFIQGDGQKVYAPTTVLMTKLITNVRRSPDMGESIPINVDFRTPTDLLFTLRDRLAAWVNEQPREFAAGFDVRLQEIVDLNKLVLTVWLPHKGNWQNVGKRLQRRNRFMFMLKDTLQDLDIHYELPAQRITSQSEGNPFGSSSQQHFQNNSTSLPHNTRMYKSSSTAADADGS